MPVIDPSAHIAPSASIAADSRVLPGAYVGAHVRLEAGTVVGPHAVLLDAEEGAPTFVRPGVAIGASAVVHPGLTLAANCLLRPGAVVTRSVPPAAIVEGNPASITGYVDTHQDPGASAQRVAVTGRTASVEPTAVRGVTLHRFPVVPDLRGHLTVGEFERDIPFHPLRYFMVFGVPNREIRGEHAHRVCHQFLLCPRGSCAVVADDGLHRTEVLLDAPHLGIYLPPMVWGIQYKYSADALLLVFASHHYDAADYIRDYDEFKRLVTPAA